MGAGHSGIDSHVPGGVDYSKVPCFRNADGLYIYSHHWPVPQEKQPVRGLLFLAHGLGEYCDRRGYDTLAEKWTDIGVAVIAHDHVGHGRSQGPRGTVKDFSVYVRDVVQHINSKREELELTNVPVLIYGHSMGGTIAFLTALQHPDLISSMVLSAPALKPFGHQHPGFLSSAGLSVLKKLSPGTAVTKPSPPEWFSRDPEVQALEDPVCLPRTGAKAGWVSAFIHAMDFIQHNMDKIKVPFFIAHGTNDHLTNIDGSRQLFEQASSTEKTFKEIPDAVHNLHLEIKECREEAMAMFVNWVDSRLTQMKEQAESTTASEPTSEEEAKKPSESKEGEKQAEAANEPSKDEEETNKPPTNEEETNDPSKGAEETNEPSRNEEETKETSATNGETTGDSSLHKETDNIEKIATGEDSHANEEMKDS